MKKWLVFLMSLCLAALCVSALAASSRPTAYVDGGTVDQVHLRQKPASDARLKGRCKGQALHHGHITGNRMNPRHI